jgi:hypothetical protein
MTVSGVASGPAPLSVYSTASGTPDEDSVVSYSSGMPFALGNRTSERPKRRKRSASFDYNVASDEDAAENIGSSIRFRRGRPMKQLMRHSLPSDGLNDPISQVVNVQSQSGSHLTIQTEYIQNPIYSDLNPTAPGISVRDLPRIPTGTSSIGYTPLPNSVMPSAHLHASSSSFDFANMVPYNRGMSTMSVSDLANLPPIPIDRGLSFLTGQPTPIANLYGFPSMPAGVMYRDLSVLTDPGTGANFSIASPIAAGAIPSAAGAQGENFPLNHSNSNMHQETRLQDEDYKKIAAPFLEFTRTLSVESSKASPDASTRVISNASGEVKVTVPAWIAGGEAAPTRGSPFNKLDIAMTNFDGNISPITPAIIPPRKSV